MELAQTCTIRGQAHAARGELKAAIADFTGAIEHEVNFAPVYYFRGLAYEKNGNLDSAIEDFTEAIWFNTPSDIDHRAAIAEFIPDPGRPINLNVTLAETYNARGHAYEKNGDKAKAEGDFAQAKKLGGKEK